MERRACLELSPTHERCCLHVGEQESKGRRVGDSAFALARPFSLRAVWLSDFVILASDPVLLRDLLCFLEVPQSQRMLRLSSLHPVPPSNHVAWK
ncbi:GST N-terminal domain-containing protein [Psidium guajava]|nr:GST N-terminal domain-containing protein [Psidium guajava]